MRKRSLLALLAIATFAAAVVVGTGASAAFAGEQTGNCNNAKAGSPAADNCKSDQNANSNSICSFSGQNDTPGGSTTQGIGGTSQSYGQDVKAGQAFPNGTPGPPNGPGIVPIDPSTQNKGHTDTPQPQPGYQCNGHDNPLK
jgi:hypothetical protein